MNRTTKNALLLSMLGGLALSANVWGQGPPKSMDSDGDGLISVKEHAAGAKAMFERMDANRDGNLTVAEMDAGHAMKMKHGAGMHGGHPMPGKGMGPGMPAGGMMGMMDSNRDGAITAQEHAAHAKAMFDKLDVNHDGKVIAAEVAAGHEAMMKEGHGMHRGADKPGMGHGRGIRNMDRNGDGKVSAAEHAAGAQAMFDAADTTKDGNLSKAERAAHHAAMMKRDMAPGHAMDEDDSGGR